MKSLLWVVCAFTVGCIEPSLRYCDDAACPLSTTCVNGAAGLACVDDSLLAACDGLADGDECSTADYVGACTQGICRRLTCGDGFAIDPEPCEGDDLRGATCASVGRYSGTSELRCTAACTFDPSGCGGRCGDGTRNGPEVCEVGDLGGLTCLDLGFYGGVLGCSDDCTFDTTACVGSCGDGSVNGAESCDGVNLDNHSCADRDRYRGTVSCNTVCGIEYGQCEGYCGDGLVDAADGEQCDVTPPQTACMSLGFDTGSVSCSDSCRASTDSCGHFGWEYVATVGDALYVWSDVARTVAHVGNQIVIYDGIASTTHGVANVGTVKASTWGVVVLHTDGSVEVWRAGTWSTVLAPPSFSTTGSSFGLDIADDGSLYVADWQCNVWARPAGSTAWVSLGTNLQTSCTTVVGYSPTNVWARELHYDGASWGGSIGTGTTDAERLPDASGILVSTSTGMQILTPTSSTTLATGSFVKVERGFGRPCGSRASGVLECEVGDSLRTIAPPPGAPRAFLVDGPPNALSVIIDGDLWTTRLAHWERVPQPEVTVAIAVAGGAVMIQRLNDHILDLGTATQLVIADLNKTPKGVRPLGDHWLQWTPDSFFEIFRDGSELDVGVAQGNAVSAWSDANMAVSVTAIGEMWINDITTPYAALFTADAITPPADLTACTVRDLEGRRLNASEVELFALADCAVVGTGTFISVVFRYASSQWSEYWRGTTGYADMLVPPGDDRLVLLSGQRVHWVRAGVLESQQLLPRPLGNSLAASSATDLYAVGFDDEFGRPMIWRWNGTDWLQMRAPVTSGITQAAVSADVLVVAGARLDRLNRFGF